MKKPVQTPAKTIEECREIAQQTLVNTAIKHAVHALFAQKAQELWKVDTAVEGRTFGNNEERVVQLLCNIPGEFKRVRTFNQIAKKNGFNLSIKSAGCKTPRSIQRKQSIPGMSRAPLTDEVRISFVSSNVELLNQLAITMRDALQPATEPDNIPTNIEPWFMRASALLSQIVKTSVDDFGAEIQFLPREQARMATRITHHFLKILRAYDDVTKSFEGTDPKSHIASLAAAAAKGDQNAAKEISTATRKINQANKMLGDYNKLASFLNHLASNETLGTQDVGRFNTMLRSLDESSQTLDEVSEGGEPNGHAHDDKKKKNFSPIFKTTKDFISYRMFMTEEGTKIKLFPLPTLNSESAPGEVEAAMNKLRTCSQLTHACYMKDAEEPFRKLWIEKATATNANLAADCRIPENAIAWVQSSLNLHSPAPGVVRGCRI